MHFRTGLAITVALRAAEAYAADDICSSRPYAMYVSKLATFQRAQDYCTANHPQSFSTVTETVTATDPPAATIEARRIVKIHRRFRKLTQQPDRVQETACSCIETTPTITITVTPTSDPVESSTPDPVESFNPNPVESSNPGPVESSTPDPVKSSTPNPVESSNPNPIEDPNPGPACTSGNYYDARWNHHYNIYCSRSPRVQDASNLALMGNYASVEECINTSDLMWWYRQLSPRLGWCALAFDRTNGDCFALNPPAGSSCNDPPVPGEEDSRYDIAFVAD